MRVPAALSLLLVCGIAGAERPPAVLRMATVAPEGTSFARELKAFAREVEAETRGQLGFKFYFGGIAGDEISVGDRVRRGQLDGVVSGGMLCMRMSPTLRALRVPGLVQTRDEASYVFTRLKPRVDRELAAEGYVNIGEANIGPDVLFSRTPITTFDELKRHRLYHWDLDDVWRNQLTAMGLSVKSGPLHAAAGWYASGEVDGFLSPPAAALGFQWSAQARYFTELHFSVLPACLMIATRAFDALPIESRQGLMAAAARMQARFETSGKAMDEQLVNGLFQKQGLRRVPVDERLRSEFFAAARAARAKLPPSLVPPEIVAEITAMLADYRAEHH